MIKHIVLGGGGYKGLGTVGVLKYLNQNKFYDMKNIETIYGSSVGAYIGVLLCLNIDWDDLIDYIVNRPWEKIIPIKANMFLEIIEKKGFFDDAFFRRSLENVFHSKDITLDITLKEFYEFSNIELHMFTIRISDFKTIDYSYKTHPDMKLLHAIYHTCTIPYLFKPHWYNNDYYIDGGLLNNYPVQECITNGAEKNEILGIRNHSKHPTITQKSNIFELCYYIHRHLSNIARTTHITLENEIHIPYTVDNINTFLDVMKNSNVRALHIKRGEDVAQQFLEKSTKII